MINCVEHVVFVGVHPVPVLSLAQTYTAYTVENAGKMLLVFFLLPFLCIKSHDDNDATYKQGCSSCRVMV